MMTSKVKKLKTAGTAITEPNASSVHGTSSTRELAPPSPGSRNRWGSPEVKPSGFLKNRNFSDMKAALAEDLAFIKGHLQKVRLEAKSSQLYL